MVCYEKRELNKLCRAYNDLYNFNSMGYLKDSSADDLREELKDKIENYINKKCYNLKLNSNDNFILKKQQKPL